jgi:hypothetical protein
MLITSSVNICLVHRLRLCTEKRNDKECNEVESNDATWRCMDKNKTCWEKAHEFYCKNGLWKDNVRKKLTKAEIDKHYFCDGPKPQFQYYCTSSDLYKNKMAKLGITPAKPGRKTKSK